MALSERATLLFFFAFYLNSSKNVYRPLIILLAKLSGTIRSTLYLYLQKIRSYLNWSLRVSLFLKILTSLTVCILLPSCITTKPFPLQNTIEHNCTPKATFNPSTVNITSSGVFSFSSKNQNFNYDLKNSQWACKVPNTPIVNTFEQVDAQMILETINSKKNKSSEVITKNIKLTPRTEFRSYVTKHCDLLGLSYLFQLDASPNKKVIGCQINMLANSAIMWKQLNDDPSIQVAYLPIYQPFFNQYLNSIE